MMSGGAVSGQTTAARRSKPGRRLMFHQLGELARAVLRPPLLGLRDVGLHDAQPAVRRRSPAAIIALAGKAGDAQRRQRRDRGPPAGRRRGEHEEGQRAQAIDAEQRRALQQRRGKGPDMAERIPRIAGEEVAAQPFGHRPGDRQQDQATIAAAQRRPAIDEPARDAGRKAREEAEEHRQARHDRRRRAARSRPAARRRLRGSSRSRRRNGRCPRPSRAAARSAAPAPSATARRKATMPSTASGSQ